MERLHAPDGFVPVPICGSPFLSLPSPTWVGRPRSRGRGGRRDRASPLFPPPANVVYLTCRQ